MPYNTCLLADYLSEGAAPKTIWTKTSQFFTEHNITLQRDTRIVELNPLQQYALDQHGTRYSYDTVFIGTGTSAHRLPTEKPVLSGLFNFQTMYDTQSIDTFIRTENPQSAIVIGAGLSGIECADALNERGISVTIVEYGTHLLPTLLNSSASSALVHHINKTTTVYKTECGVAQVCVSAHGRASGVDLMHGERLHADMVIVAIGARPNSDFAAAAGLRLSDSCIAVDNQMQTSHETIFAGGDVAVPRHDTPEALIRSCTWPDAMQHGMYAARAMAGTPLTYPGVTPVISSHFYGTQFIAAGPISDPPSHYTSHTKSGPGWYQHYLIHENKLKGFVLVDKLSRIGTLRRALTTQELLSETVLT